jgi:hypothetical protein
LTESREDAARTSCRRRGSTPWWPHRAAPSPPSAWRCGRRAKLPPDEASPPQAGRPPRRARSARDGKRRPRGTVGPAPLRADGFVRARKRRAEGAGLDPTGFAGHSLRAGFLTSAAVSGADALKIVEVSRHRSMDALRRYGEKSDPNHPTPVRCAIEDATSRDDGSRNKRAEVSCQMRGGISS